MCEINFPNLTEWIPVATDFIKIGIPALVTAGAALGVAAYQSKSSIAKFKFERKNDLLTQAASGYEAYFQAYYRYSNNLLGLANAEQKFKEFVPDVANMVASKLREIRLNTVELRKKMAEEMHNVASSQSKLMLLGDKECVDAADRMQMAILNADAAFKFDGTNYDLTEFNALHTTVAECRRDLYLALQKATGARDG